MSNLLLTLNSIHHVLKAEKLLIERGFTPRVIPTPKDISSECGMSLVFSSDNDTIETILEILDKNDLKYMIYNFEK